MKLSHAIIFNATMLSLWQCGETDAPNARLGHAIASHVKTYKGRNVDNAFEVLDIVWEDDVVGITETPDAREICGQREKLMRVDFVDGSYAVVFTRLGIGNGIAEVG